ncbi:MAG: hypothetical protein ACD_84C00004G0002 [uncultured bacterium]|nr:MAG: hypothetical protein ACD_84C00004G0002 [uncultured bacterium]
MTGGHVTGCGDFVIGKEKLNEMPEEIIQAHKAINCYPALAGVGGPPPFVALLYLKFVDPASNDPWVDSTTIDNPPKKSNNILSLVKG